MKNKLTLHEAIAKVLSTKQNKTASYEEIASEIENENLFPIRKGNITLSRQIYLRTSISSSKYKDSWFKVIDKDSIKLIK